MTKYGETHNFKGIDFIQKIEMYLGRPVDGIICNNRRPKSEILKKYLAENSEFVEIEHLGKDINNRLICEDDLLDASVEIVRHDSKKLASLIQSIIFKKYFFECEKLIDEPMLMQFPLKDSGKMPIKDESFKILGKTAC